MDGFFEFQSICIGYLNQPDVFDRAFPTAIRPQGGDCRTWLYYTLLKSTLLLITRLQTCMDRWTGDGSPGSKDE